MDSSPSPSQATVELNTVRPSSLKRRTHSDQSVARQSQTSTTPAVRFKRKDADEIITSDALYVSAIDRPTKLFLTPEQQPEPTFDLTPITVMTALRQRSLLSPDAIALASKMEKRWRYITFYEYHDRVLMVAKAFIKLGLERHHGVGILGDNSPEWFIANLAAIFAGGVSVALDVQLTAAACQQIASDSKCNIILVDSEEQCSRILEVKERLPHLKIIAQLSIDSATRLRPNVHTWQELVKIGQDCSDDDLDDRVLQQAPNLCCTLIYKTAPSGERRGVMLSHDNLIWTAIVVGNQLDVRYDRGRVVSFLPLSSTYNQVFDIYLPILYGAAVHFATTPDLFKGVLETIKEVRPTLLMAVPGLYDRMFEKMVVEFQNHVVLKQKLTTWATRIGKRVHRRYSRGDTTRPACFYLANALVFCHVRRRLGLDRTALCLTTGAPVSAKTFHFLVNLNIPILEFYGKSETSGIHTLSLPLKYRWKSVGQVLPGCSIEIINTDHRGHGEILAKGRNVFMGYLRDPVATMQSFNAGEWYKTGDRGITADDDFLFITGRIKDLLVTESGNKVSPKPIEDAVKSKLPCVSHCIVVGEGRPHVSVLLTLKTEGDGEALEPSDRLSPSTIQWLRVNGYEGVTTVREVRVNMGQMIKSAIQESIDSVNREAMSKSEYIGKWVILPKDFSIRGGELDHKNKMDRRVVLDKYSEVIDALYQRAGPTH